MWQNEVQCTKTRTCKPPVTFLMTHKKLSILSLEKKLRKKCRDCVLEELSRQTRKITLVE